MGDDLDCSIVYAVTAGAHMRDIEANLNALIVASAGVRTEVLVIADTERLGALQKMMQGLAQLVISNGCTVRAVGVAAASLVPERWGAGLRAASGSAVMFTTSQMRVLPSALRAMRAALNGTIAGVGGPIALPVRQAFSSDAIFFARFSAFAVGLSGESRTVAHIPGDNAMYMRNAITAYPDLNRRAFWEVEYHERLRRDGLQLTMVPEAIAMFIAQQSLPAVMHERYTHGRQFGMSRVASGANGRLRVIAAAPIVPVVMLVRAFRRAVATPGYAWRFVVTSPVLALLFVAWALGEAAGAAQSPSSAQLRTAS